MIGFPRRELVDAFAPGIGIWENDEHRDETMRRIIAQGPFKGIEVEYPRRDGSRVTLLISAETIEIHGEPRVLFSVVDMTELKHLETENLKVKKLESIATLSGGIAHDFNNILTAVMGNLSLATLSCSQDQELRTTIDNAYSACLRAKDLTWKLLVFSRGGLPEKKRVSLREVIAEAESLSLRGSQTEGNAISCVTRFADDELIVSGDRALLIQVFHNFSINAIHAMPIGGSITVIERIMSAADIPTRGYLDTINPGTYCSISITDTGSGIPKPVIANIFDPYYSTKPNGTGLGLSIVYSIVKNHGGHIAVDSDEGKGTTFRILLPLAEPDTVSH